MLSGRTSPWKRIGTALLIPGDTSSPDCVIQAKQWIRTCHGSHQMCRGKTPSPLPKRVVEIFDFRDNHPHIRLYESHGEREHYVCLSHCWGNHKPTETTTESLGTHKTEIPWLGLTRTFQEAVIFTRNLGLRYIWIDSLCILQNSERDWIEESGKMCEVFGSAYLTLFATKARSGNDGLYGSSMRNERPLRLHGTDPITKKPYILYSRCISRTSHFYDSPDPATLRRSLPLLTRGWVYQERLMSPRILHFGEQEISWECSGETICQCSGLKCVTCSKNTPKQSYLNDLIAGEPSESDLASIWHALVTEYSRLMLTYSSDRLAALAGLASKMQRVRKGRYLAGLWEDSIILDLCWYSPPQPANRSECLVPTWSWAAIKSGVRFLLEEYGSAGWVLKSQFAECVDILFDRQHEDNSDSISQMPKVIILKGFLDAVVVTKSITLCGLRFLDINFPPDPIGPDELGNRDCRIYLDEDSQLSENESFLVSGMRILWLQKGSKSLCGYLLLSANDPQRMLFKRVGFMTIWVQDQLEPWRHGSKKLVTITIQ